MKCNIVIIVFLAVVLGLQSCSNFLTVDIPDSLTKKEYWKSKDHAEAALAGVYTAFGSNIQRFIYWGGVRSEIYSAPNGNASIKQFIDQDIRITNDYCNWKDVYTVISRANSFLKNIHLVLNNDRSFTLGQMDEMKGQVYAVRALNYFYLVRAFKEVPYQSEPYESDTQAPYAAAVSEEILLDSIEADLSLALQLAPESFDRPEENCGYITKRAVRAIWADVKLWRKKYQECVDLCDELARDYDGQMLTWDTWYSMFASGNSKESIFEYQYLEEGPASVIGTLFYSPLAANRSAYYYNVRKVYPQSGQYETIDTIRPQRTVSHVSYGGNAGFSGVFKYLGISADNGQYVLRDENGRKKVNFIFYRYREVLLMKAEALGAMERYSEAVESINKIRLATALETVTPEEMGTDEGFMDKIICEYRTELAYEGKDWFTLVRIARNTGYKGLLIDRVSENSSSMVKEQTLKAYLDNPESWFLPYLDSEVQDNLLLKQKEFYKGKK